MHKSFDVSSGTRKVVNTETSKSHERINQSITYVCHLLDLLRATRDVGRIFLKIHLFFLVMERGESSGRMELE